MRHLFTILFALHGVIHVLGFLEWSRIAKIQQLSGRTAVSLNPFGERLFAAAWLAALLLLLAAAGLRWFRHDSWWPFALSGILLSQGLIVMAWSDARYGTVANLLLALPVIAALAESRFSASVDRERSELLRASSVASSVVTLASTDSRPLPPPVRHWLEASGSLGRRPARTVVLEQRGQLRTDPDSAWMPATARQTFTVDPPGFIWQVKTTMFGALPVSGRDLFAHGRGSMRIAAAGLSKVVDAEGDKIDHGTMLRFLGEIVWFPSAALASYVSWQPIDQTRARATMQHENLAVTAIFEFDEQGRVVGLHAERYLGGEADAQLTPWTVSCTDWQRFEGIEVPSRGDVAWILPSGRFSYYLWEITRLEFDRAGVSPSTADAAPHPVRRPT